MYPAPARAQKCVFFLRTSLFLIVCLLALTAPVMAQQVPGAIYTTTSTGTTVNANLYDAKTSVYLNGGPQGKNNPGLSDGPYYFQVTDPSGAVLLSADDISCREVVVSGGRIIGVPSGAPPSNCTSSTPAGGFHPVAIFNPANGDLPVQLCPTTPSSRSDNLAAGTNFDASNWCDTTPNSGGEYKVWLTPISNYSPNGSPPQCSSKSNITYGFCDSDSKTDNFKVAKPQAAYITVCKFNDLDGNGQQDPVEPFIAGWPITATGVDTLSGPIGTVNTQTGPDGCVSFSVSNFSTTPPGTGGVVTVTEGFLTGSWQETAPAVGTYTVPDGMNPADNGTVMVTVSNSGAPSNTQSLTIVAGDNITLANFGNTCLDSTCGGNTIELTVSKDANPSLTRTYAWTITKGVDSPTVYSAGGTAAPPANYTVQVTHDNGTDSGWQVTGTIKITNPSLVDIAGVDIADNVDNSGACTVTNGSAIPIPAKSTVNVPYICQYTAQPPNGTNTATATWNSGTTTPGIATGTMSVNF